MLESAPQESIPEVKVSKGSETDKGQTDEEFTYDEMYPNSLEDRPGCLKREWLRRTGHSVVSIKQMEKRKQLPDLPDPKTLPLKELFFARADWISGYVLDLCRESPNSGSRYYHEFCDSSKVLSEEERRFVDGIEARICGPKEGSAEWEEIDRAEDAWGRKQDERRAKEQAEMKRWEQEQQKRKKEWYKHITPTQFLMALGGTLFLTVFLAIVVSLMLGPAGGIFAAVLTSPYAFYKICKEFAS